MLDDSLDNMNEKLINGACFFYIKKCFDTIDHSLLILKLGNMLLKIVNYFGSVIISRIVHKLLKLMEISRHLII